MRERVNIIYQPKFLDDTLGIVAQPDFLLLESDGYRAADAKLTHSISDKTDLRIQLAVYQRVLGSELPTKAFLGNGEQEVIQAKDLERAEEFLADMASLSDSPRPEAHFSASKCNACGYRSTRIPEFESIGDLGQNYFLRAEPIGNLLEQGISTLEQLAVQDPTDLREVPYLRGDNRRLAVLHAQVLTTGEPRTLSQIEQIAGTPIYFDIETNPLAEESDEEVYLWGFLMPPYRK